MRGGRGGGREGGGRKKRRSGGGGIEGDMDGEGRGRERMKKRRKGGRGGGKQGKRERFFVVVNTKFAMCVVEHCTPPHDITIDPSHLSSGTSPQDTTMLGSLLHTAHLTAVRWPSRV